MRVLLLFRGAMGCGKSTFIAQHGLKRYTLCADKIRMLCQSPVLSINDGYTISQKNDKLVWEIMFDLLENRMKRGEFTVIDATNTKTSEMSRYKKLADKYRYRIYCVDMTDIPMEVAKERNFKRYPQYKRVPVEAIERAYARFATQQIPSGITVIKPNELDKIWYKPIDLSEYHHVHIIGDIHGCYTALKEFMDKYENNSNDFFIFLGDYLDRGIENAKVLEYLMNLQKNNPNTLFLEGNHEAHLRNWASGEYVKSKRFVNFTAKELESAGIDKKDVRSFCRRLAQCAYFTYQNGVFLVTHGGLTTIPECLTYIATEQMVNGVGDYGDEEDVARLFDINTADHCYQIHGHRNVNQTPIKENKRTFNLCDDVEWGGNLRAITLTHVGNRFKIDEHCIKNTVFSLPSNITMEAKEVENKELKDIVEVMRASKYVEEKKFGDISSFNFTRQAFEKRAWDGITVKARGLFIDTKNYEVALRGYDKFFNYEENDATSAYSLKRNIKFPVNVYIKENGFLGLVSADSNGNIIFATKAQIGSNYAQILKKNMYDIYGEKCVDKIAKFCYNNNVTMLFECIDTKLDPHIIKYKKNECILLDIVDNDMKFSKMPYIDMCNVAMEIGVEHKYFDRTINNYDDLMDYISLINKDYFTLRTDRIDDECVEGFVFEDDDGFMFKLKTPYYREWKMLRNVAHTVLKTGTYNYTSRLLTKESNDFYGWLRWQYNNFIVNNDKDGRYELMQTDIITLRDMYKGEKENE